VIISDQDIPAIIEVWISQEQRKLGKLPITS